MRQLLQQTAERAISYLENLGDRSVAPSADAVAKLATLDQPLNEQPTPPEQVIDSLDEFGSPATMAMAGPRFFGFVIGGSLPVTLAANWLAGAWDQNTGLYTPTPATAQLEQVALSWLLDLFELPRESRRRVCHRRDHGELLGARRRAPRACSSARAGTSKPTACSARRRSR